MLLENIERLMDHSAFSKDQYLVSQTDDQGQILLQSILSTVDFIKLKANERDLKIALTTSIWLAPYTTVKPIPIIRLPFQIDKKTLILYDIPNLISLHDIIYFVSMITRNNEFKAEPHKLGVSITFKSAEQCMAFWRTLNICRLNGFLLKGMISVQKIHPKPYTMGRSHSMTFQHKKKRNGIQKPQRAPLQIVYSMKDNDFPSLN